MTKYPVHLGEGTLSSYLLNKTKIYETGYLRYMFKVKSEIIHLDKCFIPGIIVALESPPQIGKIFLLVSLSFVLLVLIDNKIMFRNVLFLERNLRHGKYSRYVSIHEKTSTHEKRVSTELL